MPDDDPRPTHAAASALCAAAQPNALLRSSRTLGWSTLLLDHESGAGRSDLFETHPTPDVTLVVALRGRHRIEVLKRQAWQGALYQPGAAGLTAPGETMRLRWATEAGSPCFETAHLYLPHRLLQETADHLRRIGQPEREVPLSALVFDDPAVSHAASALLRAMQAGAPDLYAQQVANWLAIHLLSRHAGWLDLADDTRDPGTISDARLARTIEFMSRHLSQRLGVEQLAREAGISRHHFSRLFRARTGMAPAAYLRELRLQAARRSLATTDTPIAAIAAACGYEQASAFITAFGRRYGTSPAAFRRGATA